MFISAPAKLGGVVFNSCLCKIRVDRGAVKTIREEIVSPEAGCPSMRMIKGVSQEWRWCAQAHWGIPGTERGLLGREIPSADLSLLSQELSLPKEVGC